MEEMALAKTISDIILQQELSCPMRRRVVNNIRAFNKYQQCNCCEKHSLRKPADIFDTRRGQRFPAGDRRNYFGTHEDIADDERIDTMTEKYPRVFVFKLSSEKCTCTCRHSMRNITDDVKALCQAYCASWM